MLILVVLASLGAVAHVIGSGVGALESPPPVTVISVCVPLIDPVTMSVAVTVCSPAVFIVTICHVVIPSKIFTPLSAAKNM